MNPIYKDWFVNQEKKLIYIRLPKCAGTSMHRFKGPFRSFQKSVKQLNLQNSLNEYKTFTIVRNPLNRFVSAYFYLHQINKINYKADINKFINDIKTNKISPTTSPLVFDHIRPMHHFTGTTLPNYIIKLENLDYEWDKFSNIYKLSNEIPKINQGEYFVKIPNTPELIEFVNQYFKKDFKLFNYD
jgi:hypothetical protein